MWERVAICSCSKGPKSHGKDSEHNEFQDDNYETSGEEEFNREPYVNPLRHDIRTPKRIPSPSTSLNDYERVAFTSSRYTCKCKYIDELLSILDREVIIIIIIFTMSYPQRST